LFLLISLLSFLIAARGNLSVSQPREAVSPAPVVVQLALTTATSFCPPGSPENVLLLVSSKLAVIARELASF